MARWSAQKVDDMEQLFNPSMTGAGMDVAKGDDAENAEESQLVSQHLCRLSSAMQHTVLPLLPVDEPVLVKCGNSMVDARLACQSVGWLMIGQALARFRNELEPLTSIPAAAEGFTYPQAQKAISESNDGVASYMATLMDALGQTSDLIASKVLSKRKADQGQELPAVSEEAKVEPAEDDPTMSFEKVCLSHCAEQTRKGIRKFSAVLSSLFAAVVADLTKNVEHKNTKKLLDYINNNFPHKITTKSLLGMIEAEPMERLHEHLKVVITR